MCEMAGLIAESVGRAAHRAQVTNVELLQLAAGIIAVPNLLKSRCGIAACIGMIIQQQMRVWTCLPCPTQSPRRQGAAPHEKLARRPAEINAES